jgi:hypothetical protein
MNCSAPGAFPRSFLLATLGLLLSQTPVPAQGLPPAPPPPERFNAALRYRITSARDQHVAAYDAMIEHLKKSGFEFNPPLDAFPETDREDRSKSLLTGTIGARDFLKLFSNIHVETLLLVPPGFKQPPPDRPVLVRLELLSGLVPARQQELANQTRVLLHALGFVESTGYDHRGYTGRPFTRLVGTLPATLVSPFPPGAADKDVDPETLLSPPLLGDLRDQPSGWLSARIAREDLPMPLRLAPPVRVIEVLPDADPPQEPPPPPARAADFLYKISPDLWALAGPKDQQGRLVRMEIILAYTPEAGEGPWRDLLIAGAPSLMIEGRTGPIVTGLARAGQAQGLAELGIVSTVRLAHPARVTVDPALKVEGDNARALSQTGLERLHKATFRGRKVRVAVIDSDFTGYEELVKAGRLPATTRYVDVTAERSYDLLPDLPEEEPKGPGHGARCALAVVLAAPEAELTLIRIDPAAPHMLQAVASYITGAAVRSEYLDLRNGELVSEAAALRLRRQQLLAERKRILENFEDEADFDREYGLLGAAGAWLFSDRRWHFLRMEELERDVREHGVREQRFLKLTRALQELRGTEIVSNSLVWEDGYAVGGGSPLSRWFDELPHPCFLWFQSAGNTQGQSWAGVFRDEDGNGVMEFVRPGAKLPPGRWTPELSFLGWQPYAGAASPELPAGAKVRLTLQWREPHDPTLFFRPGEPDLYRNPLADLRLVILRQRDPAGKALPADAFEVVARVQGLPQRLDNQPNASTYEHVVEFTVPKGGRYAVRVERALPSRWRLLIDPQSRREAVGLVDRLTPTGIRPLGTPTLPDLERNWELRPRLFVSAVDDKLAKTGRPVFADFPTDMGTVGMPADARALLAVGAAGFDDRPEPASAKGPPAHLDYFICPQVLAYDRLDLGVDPPGVAFGTSLATPFAAGTAASLHSAGLTYPQLLRQLRLRPGTVFTSPWQK